MSRKVLSKKLSPKGEELLKYLEQSFGKSIMFYPIRDLEHYGELSSYGAVDCHSPEAYKVWLREDFSLDVFESNLFHELHHIEQIEKAFPIVCNKDTDLLHSSESLFFEEIGAHIQSAILDIDVHNWLASREYSSDFFVQNRFEGFMKNKDINYDRLDDKYNFANLVLAFFTFFTFANEQQKSQFKDAYGRYPKALLLAEDLAKTISSIGPWTPKKAALSMGILIDRLNIWDSYYIILNAQKIRTTKEFETFKSSCILE